jgi:isopenicillin N synthase-like dioxygenase
MTPATPNVNSPANFPTNSLATSPATLPKVNIASLCDTSATPAQRQQCHAQLYHAFTTVGFAIVQGACVPPGTLRQMRAAVQATFAAPRALYHKHTVQKDNYRGYVPLGFFTPNAGGALAADHYEAWKLHQEVAADDPITQACALYGPNRWPPIDFDVKAAVLAYWAEMDRITHALLRALAQCLGLDAHWLLSTMAQPLTNMTLLNYPSAPAAQERWGIHPHKDFNFLTVLAHDPVGGLEVRSKDGSWLDARCADNEYVVNIGDMLELVSGARLVSTPHRVRNRSQQARQSFPYFAVPRFDVQLRPRLDPLPGFAPRTLQAGAASRAVWYSNWPDEALNDPALDVGDYG